MPVEEGTLVMWVLPHAALIPHVHLFIKKMFLLGSPQPEDTQPHVSLGFPFQSPKVAKTPTSWTLQSYQ